MVEMSALLDKANSLQAGGKEIIDCVLGEVSHGLDKKVVKLGKKLLETEYSYIKPIRGYTPLRDNIARLVNRECGVDFTPDNVIVTPGAGLAIDMFYRTFLNPGDEVVIFDPFYIPFVVYARIYQANPVLVDTYDTKFQPCVEILRKKITRRTKVIVINSPNNPTGRIIPKEIINEIASEARNRGLIILSDETYSFLDYEGNFVSPLFFYPEGTVVVRSFSKEFSMMGYKVGYIAADSKIICFLRRLQFPCWGAPRLSSIMANAALEFTSKNRKKMRVYRKMRDVLYRRLTELDIIEYMPEGAIYFYVKSPYSTALDYARRLAHEGLLVSPGFSKRNTHIRLAYGNLMKADIPKVMLAFERSMNDGKKV